MCLEATYRNEFLAWAEPWSREGKHRLSSKKVDVLRVTDKKEFLLENSQELRAVGVLTRDRRSGPGRGLLKLRGGTFPEAKSQRRLSFTDKKGMGHNPCSNFFLCLSPFLSLCVYTWLHVCVRAHMKACVCVHVRTCVCMCVYTCGSQKTTSKFVFSFQHVGSRNWPVFIRLVSKHLYPLGHLTSPGTHSSLVLETTPIPNRVEKAGRGQAWGKNPLPHIFTLTGKLKELSSEKKSGQLSL